MTKFKYDTSKMTEAEMLAALPEVEADNARLRAALETIATRLRGSEPAKIAEAALRGEEV